MGPITRAGMEYSRHWYHQRSLLVRFNLRDLIDDFLRLVKRRGLRIGQIKLSLREFRTLLADPDFVDRYADGRYRDIPLRLVTEDVWT